MITLTISLLGWTVLPFSKNIVFADLDLGLLYIFAISSLNVYGIIIAGWSSNSKYAFLGSLRSAAQMVSYEVSIGLILLNVLVVVGSLNFSEIIEAQKTVWFVFPFFPIFLMFFISSLAETNRPPFDLPEAEAELVAGYNVEYSAVGFAFFFIGEYANIILMSFMSVLFFFGGWLPFWFIKFLPYSFNFAIKVIMFLLLFLLSLFYHILIFYLFLNLLIYSIYFLFFVFCFLFFILFLLLFHFLFLFLFLFIQFCFISY